MKMDYVNIVEVLSVRINAVYEPAVLIDGDFSILHANDGFRQVFGVSNEDCKGFCVFNVIEEFDSTKRASAEQLSYNLQHFTDSYFFYVFKHKGVKMAYFCRFVVLSFDGVNERLAEIHFHPMGALFKFVSQFLDASVFSKGAREKTDISGSVNITKRQDEYLFYLVLGYSNSEIAMATNTSVKTVENTILNIKKKINNSGQFKVKNRDEIKRWAIQSKHACKPSLEMFNFGIIPVDLTWIEWNNIISK